MALLRPPGSSAGVWHVDLRRALPVKKRKVAYTFIIGDYDDLKTPIVFTEGWDYICFTDNAGLRSDFWDVRLSTRRGADRELENKKFAAKHMILFQHYIDDYHLSVSVGGQILINCNLEERAAKNISIQLV